jgi:tripartite-type tricarboxylate transporter receptor subunit TctC
MISPGAAICMFALVVAQSALANAQAGYPSRSVRIVVPSSVGGGADLLARQLSAGLQQKWKQGISVENKVGGGGNIGTLDVVRSQPDGYTLLVQNSSMVANYAISTKKPYSPEKDLTPIMLVGVSPLAVFAHPSFRANSIRDLASLARSDPGTISYGSCGVGTPHHFAMEVLKIKLAMKMEHVSYKGCSPEVTDVVAGQIPLGIATANLIAPYVAAGRLKVLGVSGSKPYQLLPGAPTLESQGLPIQDFSIW